MMCSAMRLTSVLVLAIATPAASFFGSTESVTYNANGATFQCTLTGPASGTPVVLLHGEDRRTSFQQPFREHTGSRSDLEDPRSAQITCEFQGSLQHSCVRQEVLSKVSVWCMETEERIDVGARRSGHGPTALGSLLSLIHI